MFQKHEFLILFIISSIFFIYYWYRGKKDGFDIECLFDILFFSSGLSALVYFLASSGLNYLRLYNPLSVLLRPSIDISLIFISLMTFFVTIFVMAKIRSWSIYRLYDLVFMSAILAFAFYGLIYGIVAFKFYLGLLSFILLWAFKVFISLKERYIPSGYFSVFIILFLGIGFYIYEKNAYNLIYTFVCFSTAFYLLYARFKRFKVITPND